MRSVVLSTTDHHGGFRKLELAILELPLVGSIQPPPFKTVLLEAMGREKLSLFLSALNPLACVNSSITMGGNRTSTIAMGGNDKE